MIVTDPAGHRTGYNPFTQQTYSEIPGATYIQPESIDSQVDDVSTVAEARFEGLQPIAGQYRVQVFAQSSSSYRLTSYSSDSTGTINGITDKKGTLKSGASVEVAIDHSAQAIPVRYSSLTIKRGDFYDSRRRDFAFLQGQIKPIDGHSISSITKSLSVKVGPFAKAIDAKALRKYKVFGHTFYTYIDWGRNGIGS